MAKAAQGTGEAGQAVARRRLKDGALGGLALLALINVVGIYLNLYVTLHDTSGDSGVFSAVFASAAGVLHVVLALVLFVGGVVMVVHARRSADARLQALAVLALLSFLIAAYSGYHFVAMNDSAYSFTMELGFLGAVLCEGGILAVVGGPSGIEPARPAPIDLPAPP
ncbi:MAG: hypothetical protein L3J91_05325 [Thermoplasmata archaeon]|nr:hypothetical protein [Thermoplasmata archaeon]